MFDTVSVTVSTKADVVDMPSYFCVDEWVASLDRRRVVGARDEVAVALLR